MFMKVFRKTETFGKGFKSLRERHFESTLNSGERVTGSEPVGRRFKSFRVRQILKVFRSGKTWKGFKSLRKTPNALVVQLADTLDSKFRGFFR